MKKKGKASDASRRRVSRLMTERFNAVFYAEWRRRMDAPDPPGTLSQFCSLIAGPVF